MAKVDKFKTSTAGAFNREQAFKEVLNPDTAPVNKADDLKEDKEVKPVKKPLNKKKAKDFSKLEEMAREQGFTLTERKSQSVHLLIKPSIYRKIKEEAKKERISVNELINRKLGGE